MASRRSITQMLEQMRPRAGRSFAVPRQRTESEDVTESPSQAWSRPDVQKFTALAGAFLLAAVVQSILLGAIEDHVREAAHTLASGPGTPGAHPTNDGTDSLLQKASLDYLDMTLGDVSGSWVSTSTLSKDNNTPDEPPPCVPLQTDDNMEDYTKYEAQFMTMWFDKEGFGTVLELPLEAMQKGIQFGVSAMIMDGELSHGQWSDNRAEYLMMLKLAPNGEGVDFFKVDMTERRPEDPDYQKLWEMHKKSGQVYSLYQVGMRMTGDCSKQVSVFVDASHLAGSAFTTPLLFYGDLGGKINSKTASAHPHNIDYTLDDGQDKYRICVYELPAEAMKGRPADDRVGYFHQTFTMLGDYTDAPHWETQRKDKLIHPAVRLIQRQRLPNLRTGRNEIHYYVDPTVPEPFREATRRGIQAWQGAFDELAPYFDSRDAPRIIAHCPGDADWPKDYDVADIRFNSVSWSQGYFDRFAVGLSVSDPRTGEILKANILFSLGWIEYYLDQAKLFGITHLSADIPNREGLPRRGGDEVMQSMVDHLKSRTAEIKSLKQKSNSKDVKLALSRLRAGQVPQMTGKRREAFMQLRNRTKQSPLSSVMLAGTSNARKTRRHRSNQEGMTSSAWGRLATTMWHAAANPTPEESLSYLQAGIQDMTSREVGYTLGLRANFQGSSTVPFDQLYNRSYAEKYGLTSSVMDHMPPVFISEGTRQWLKGAWKDKADPDEAYQFSPVVGGYDKFAIKYGYAKLGEEDRCPKDWCPMGSQLRHIAEETTWEFGLFHMGEFPNNPDINMNDASNDPVRWWQEQTMLVREGMQGLFSRNLHEGRPWSDVGYPAFELILATVFAGENLARSIGGVRTHRKHGRSCVEGGLPVNCKHNGKEAVPRAEQGHALAAIIDIIVNLPEWVPEWARSEVVLDGGFFYGMYPPLMDDLIRQVQDMILLSVLEPPRLEALVGSESMPNGFGNGLYEWLFAEMTRALFKINQGKESWTGPFDGEAQAVIGALKQSKLWNAQAFYIELLDYCQVASEHPKVRTSCQAERARINIALYNIYLFFSPDDMEQGLIIAYIVDILFMR